MHSGGPAPRAPAPGGHPASRGSPCVSCCGSHTALCTPGRDRDRDSAVLLALDTGEGVCALRRASVRALEGTTSRRSALRVTQQPEPSGTGQGGAQRHGRQAGTGIAPRGPDSSNMSVP